MGTYRKGNDWYIDYYVHGRRKREKVGPSKKLADDVLRKRKIQIAENKFLDIRRQNKIKFEDFAHTYLELHSKPNKKSYRTDLDCVKKLKSFLGGRYLYEIDSMLVEKFKIQRAKEVSPASVNRELALLKHMFTKAIEWNKANNNPVKKVKLFKENNKRLRYLEKEEIAKLLKNSRSHLKPIVVVALNTGLRRGELLGLKWHDIDFRRNVIHINNTKNGEKREIPANEMVKTALIRVRKHPESPYVFCKKDGEPYYNLRKSFFTALEKSGIVNFRFHDLRHTFASQLVMSGVDLNTVRDLLGHKSLEMTLRYSHLSPDHKKRAVDVLARQMDTIWTPEGKSAHLEKKHSFVTV